MLIDLINDRPPSETAQALLVTEPLPPHGQVDAITFSGGVAEYIYGREQSSFQDLGAALHAFTAFSSSLSSPVTNITAKTNRVRMPPTVARSPSRVHV